MDFIFLSMYTVNFVLIENAITIPFAPNVLAAVFGYELIKMITKHTTIGNKISFGEMVSQITDRIQSTKFKRFIERISYSKIFICEPCHTFWLALFYGTMINFSFSLFFIDAIIREILFVIPWSFYSYFKSKKRNDSK